MADNLYDVPDIFSVIVSDSDSDSKDSAKKQNCARFIRLLTVGGCDDKNTSVIKNLEEGTWVKRDKSPTLGLSLKTQIKQIPSYPVKVSGVWNYFLDN